MPRPCSFPAQWLLLLGLLLRLSALAQSPDDYLTRIPDPKRLGETYVSNPDAVLSPATVQDLNATLQALDQSGRAHIDVVVASSIGAAVPKVAATALFNRWKIGDKTKDNGLLMLLVMDQRRIEFETGYGLEADLPDVICYRIQQQYMVPALRAGQPNEAVRQGVAAVIRQLSTGQFAQAGADSLAASYGAAGAETNVLLPLAEEGNAPAYKENIFFIVAGVVAVLGMLLLYSVLWYYTAQGSTRHYWAILALLVPFGLGLTLLLVDDAAWGAALLLGLGYVLPWLYTLWYLRGVEARRRGEWAALPRHQQYQQLQQAHHGLGFTAWLFALPLAWYWPRHRRRMTQLREAPYACPTCGQPMRRLSETDDDGLLHAGERVEERIKSVDYDVWRCDACQHTLKLDYQNLSSDAEPCPKCHFRTFQDAGRQVVQAATTSSAGWGWHRHRCRHCAHETKERYDIARISESSSSSSGGSSSSSSYSSGSSSSSSSGGSSGGGGAGSSW
ncbi:TPM domain-containing protein [Hymenobacter sp. 15J16-1T3B]|uniref:TPM domain-containing protein n=1 Tax=Hymenobacter sp. 15J16-1T3B TaxID=2886941 RepID=UPI001D106AE0|nr:TPM domain-containing protein [Hymenobacter sp. 15J16-1T3B]MCC3156582.1 TPM domain-containing protein [Hymenobacter sp. 15J16-1T3B]